MSAPTWKNPIVKWIDYRLPVFTMMHHDLVDYPTPRNLNYWWSFGSLAGIVLVIMIATGVVLAMNYTPHVDLAFASVERIMRDVNYGWLFRYVHMNGGSVFFFVIYIHILRGLYFGSYKAPREILWVIGVVIFLTMMATAFVGYVLPWGQMSFWAATVITKMFTAVPLIGEPIVTLLWGGPSVANPTLNRFYAFHYLLPFVLFGLVFVHLWALHVHKSNNPLGIDVKGPQDTIPFHPYYTIKDLFGLGVMLLVYLFFVFFAPDTFGEAINYIEADPLVTPPHIVPEWYFLPYYAILRAFTDDYFLYWPISWLMSAKQAGVIAMFGSTLILMLMPWLDRCKVRSARYRPYYKQAFWVFVVVCLVLGWIGANPPEGHFIILGQIFTALYFSFFLIVVPVLGIWEPTRALPESISAAVIKKEAE